MSVMVKPSERDLVQEFSAAKQKLAEVKDEQKKAQAEYDRIEILLLEHLEAKQAETTARYDRLGYVRIQKPRLYASCAQEHMDELLEHLKKQGRDDLVSVEVKPSTLSTYVAECIEHGQEVPQFVTYWLKPALRIYNT